MYVIALQNDFHHHYFLHCTSQRYIKLFMYYVNKPWHFKCCCFLYHIKWANRFSYQYSTRETIHQYACKAIFQSNSIFTTDNVLFLIGLILKDKKGQLLISLGCKVVVFSFVVFLSVSDVLRKIFEVRMIFILGHLHFT